MTEVPYELDPWTSLSTLKRIVKVNKNLSTKQKVTNGPKCKGGWSLSCKILVTGKILFIHRLIQCLRLFTPKCK